jgi:hypothetical protein
MALFFLPTSFFPPTDIAFRIIQMYAFHNIDTYSSQLLTPDTYISSSLKETLETLTVPSRCFVR